MAKKSGNLLGGWAFLIGVVLAVVLALMGTLTQTLTTVLIVIGLVVGLLNVKSEETTPFLLSGAVLVIVSSLGQGVVSNIGVFDRVLNALLIIFVPATIIVALKHVFSLARR